MVSEVPVRPQNLDEWKTSKTPPLALTARFRDGTDRKGYLLKP